MAGQSRLAAGGAPGAPPAVLYAAYLESLMTRRNHGDRVFPRAAAGALVASAAAGSVAGEAGGAPATGAWWLARALAIAGLAAGAAAFDTRLRRDMAWAAVVLPVGAFLGPGLLRSLGGPELWAGTAPALRAAAFGARLDGVPGRALGLLARLGGEGDADDPMSRRLARPCLALAQAAAAVGLGAAVATAVTAPDEAVARALALRYGERIRTGPRRAPRPA